MLDCFLCSQTDFGFSDEARYEVFGFGRNVFPLVSFEVELADSHGLDDFSVVVYEEGRIAAQKHVQDESSRPQVSHVIIVMS